jgi:F-type H+-transporting ATPase subunit b
VLPKSSKKQTGFQKMEILRSLGVDWTLFIHVFCFGISFLFLSNLIMKPYMRAMHEREKRTVGSEEAAARIIEEANSLQEQFEKKAKELNSEIKSFFDKSRTEAMSQYDQMVSQAKTDASVVLKTAQTEIENQIGATRKALNAEVPGVAAAIATKLAGKEISA